MRFSSILPRDLSAGLAEHLAARGGGFRVTLGCRISKGSGLGCSAILAAGLVRGLREFARLDTSDQDLLIRAYCCERYYGRSGYQDILGGTVGGVKLIQADASTGLFSPRVDQLDLPPERLKEIPENLVVFHTGRAHFRQPYLLTIPAKYFTRSPDYMHAYENGKQLTYAMADALRDGDWPALGLLIGEYWDDREYFEEGVTPDFAQRFRDELAPLSYGTALCGSGRGGYMVVVLREGMREAVLTTLAELGVSGSDVLDFEVIQDAMHMAVE